MAPEFSTKAMIDYIKYNNSYKDDLQVLIEKLQDYIISIDTFDRVKRDPYFSSDVIDNLLTKIQNSEAQIFLATESHLVVGMAVASMKTRDKSYDLQVKKGKYGEIEKLFVLDEYRGKGIGNKLFELAENYLRTEMKCDFIEIVVFGDNRIALDIYKGKGYRAREHVLLKSVE